MAIKIYGDITGKLPIHPNNKHTTTKDQKDNAKKGLNEPLLINVFFKIKGKINKTKTNKILKIFLIIY